MVVLEHELNEVDERQQADVLLRPGSRSEAPTPAQLADPRVHRSAQYLADHMAGEVPAPAIPCINGRTDGASGDEQAGHWGI